MKIIKIIIYNRMFKKNKIELYSVKVNSMAKINIRIKKLMMLNVIIKGKARNNLRISRNQKTLLAPNKIINKNVIKSPRINNRINK